MDDLKIRSTSGLLEDLARLRRYRTSLVRRDGLDQWITRVGQLEAELSRRGVEWPELSEASAAPLCRLKPLADHVVIAPDVAPDVTEGGIIVPETAKEKPMQGTVLAVGPGRTDPGIGTIVPAVAVGDVVLFGRFAGVSVNLDDEPVLIMREEDILGILTAKAAE